MALSLASALSLVMGAAAHGMMTLPASRNGGNLKDAADVPTSIAGWYTTDTLIPGEATNCGAEYLTAVPCSFSGTDKNPWRAPGTAPVISPCGGFCVLGTGCSMERKSDVQDGVDLPKTERTQWTAGGTAKVAFAAMFNHGGGYAYRLCPAGEAQTEACFQKTHLDFFDDTSVVHWTNGQEAEIAAVTMTTGTHPPASQWRTIRIPACSGTEISASGSYCGKEILPKPCEKCCAHFCSKWDYSIVDTVAVPATLPHGNYTLSWRWDCEINDQVWQNCADLEITGASPLPPSPSPSPRPATCSFREGMGMDSYTDRVSVNSQDECCSLCVGRASCTQAVYQHGKCKFSDSSAAQVAVSDAMLCQAKTAEPEFL